MGGRGLAVERVQVVPGYLAAGLNPNQAAAAAGVSKTFAYELDRKVPGGGWLAVKEQAADTFAAGRRAAPRVAGAEKLCQQAIFMNHATSAVAPLDPNLIEVGDAIGKRAQQRGRWVL